MLQESTCMQSHSPQRVVYSVEDIAEMLSVSKGTVYNLVRQGKIKALRIGNTIRIPKQSFEEWLSTSIN